MGIKLPGSVLPKPVTDILKLGTHLHRIHSSSFQFNGFNPCLGGPARFSPITDINGSCVPSLYLASTLEAAIHETVFHNVPNNSRSRVIRRSKLTHLVHSEVVLDRDLILGKLTHAALGRMGISRQDLIGSSANLYQQTALWAEALHNQFPQLDGLVWTSKQSDPDAAYIFYGDRVISGDIHLVSERYAKYDSNFINDIVKEGRIRNIAISL